jgi:YVTN family beta-propeller protein
MLPPGKIGGQGLVFEFSNILVNAQAGTVVLRITENVGAPTAAIEEIPVSKFPQDFQVGNFKATPSEVDPGGFTELSWEGSGDATYGLSYPSAPPVSNVGPTGPYRVTGLLETTTFTLHCSSSQDGHPIEVDLQTTVYLKTPRVVSFRPAFDIVYAGQQNALEWQTVMAEHCVLKANGTILDLEAPPNSPPGGYREAQAGILFPGPGATTYELDPFREGMQGQPAPAFVFAKTLQLDKVMPGRPGWAAVAVDGQGHRAFLCNVHTNTVDVISLDDVPASEAKPAAPAGTIIGSIPVGLGPRGIALSYDRATVYVANGYSHSLSVIDVATLKNVGTIEKVPNPYGIALIGNFAYVTNLGAGANTVSVVNLAAKAVAAALPAGGRRPTGVAVTPDGTTLFVASDADGAVSVIDAARGTLRSVVAVGANPTGVAVSVRNARASSVYVTGRTAGEIVVVDARFGKVTARAPAYMRPWGLGVSTDGATTIVVGDLGVFVFELGLPTHAAANRLS